MKVELAHDILAKKVYDKASSEDKLILKIEQLIKQNFNRFRERNVLMSKDDLEYISPFLGQVHITAEQQAFISKSKATVKARRRNLRLMWAAIFLILLSSTIYSVLQSQAAKTETARALKAEGVAKTEAIRALKAEKAAVISKAKAIKAKNKAERLEKEADAAKLDALKQRDSVLIVKRKIEAALQEVQRQKTRAELQKIAADSAKAEAEIQKNAALESQRLAETREKEAIEAQEYANKQKERAINSEQKTKELYQIAQARAMSGRAIRLIRGGKTMKGVELALTAHDTVMYYTAQQQNVDDYAALQAALEELEENKRANMFNDHKEGIRAIAHHPTENVAASTDESGKILIWNWTKRQQIAEIAPPSNINRRIRTLSFTNDGKKMVGGTTDGQLLFWDYKGAETSKKAHSLTEKFDGIIEHIDFPHKTEHAHYCIFSVKNQLYLLNTKTKELTSRKFERPISALKLSYLGQFLILATGDIVYQFSLNYDQPQVNILKEQFKRQESELKQVTAISLHSLSGKLAIGNQYGTVWVANLNDFINDKNAINLGNGETEHRSRITGLDFNSNGKLLVSSSLDKTAKIWDASNLKTERLNLSGHNHWIWGAAFIGNDTAEEVVTISEDKSIRIWDTNSTTLAKKIRQKLIEFKKKNKN